MTFLRRPACARLFCGLALGLTMALQASAQTAYLPTEGRGAVGLSLAEDRYSAAWQANVFQRYVGTVTSRLTRVYGEYAFAEGWALDVNTGYGELTGGLGANPGPKKTGRLDTQLGVRWQLLDEALAGGLSPTLALRAGIVAKGSYDSRPQALGDGASGGELGVLLGKGLAHGFGVFGDLHYRKRQSPVPEDVYGSLGVYKTFGAFTLQAAYRFQRGLSGFARTPAGGRAEGRKEKFDLSELGAGYTDGGGRYYLAQYSRVQSGFNTARRKTVALSLTQPF